MKEYVLIIRDYHKDYTSGVFRLVRDNDLLFEGFSLELPWKDNQRNISCIPEGSYKVIRNKTGKHKYYRVENVEDRSLIEFHPANTVNDLAGCLSVGDYCAFDFNKETYTIWHTQLFLTKLLELVPNGFILIIGSNRKF